MDISYKKLWKLLIDRDMKKKDLEKAAGISNYVVSKMTRDRKSTRLNSSHSDRSRMPSSA